MRAPVDYSRIPDPWHELERRLEREFDYLVRRQRKRQRLLLILLATAFMASLICIGAALAHDAMPTAAIPQGWSYPWQCCSGLDCRQAKTGEIGERVDGYHTPSGEVIPMTDKRIRESPDGEFHWCAHQAGPETGKTICLFVPPRGY